MKPEKLNLWDRIFNRHRKEIIKEGEETLVHFYPNDTYHQIINVAGQQVPNSEYQKKYVMYKITDRLTGSETLKKEYLN